MSLSFFKTIEGFRRTPYCLDPEKYPQNGAKLGIGIDLGNRTFDELIELGVNYTIVAKLNKFYGLKGQYACNSLISNRLLLENDEITSLSEIIINDETLKIAKLYDTHKKPISLPYHQLTCVQRTVIASIYYNQPSLPVTLKPLLHKQILFFSY